MRWQTYYLLSSQVDLKKQRIYSPKDLIEFPWDNSSLISRQTEKEAEELLEELNAINEHFNGQKQDSPVNDDVAATL